MNNNEIRGKLEYLVYRDKRLPDGETKRQVVLATLRRLKDASISAATLADIASEEAEKMVKRLKS